MVSPTAGPPSLPRGSLRRQSSEIRTGCANERPSGSVRGVPRKRYPYRDLKMPRQGVLSAIACFRHSCTGGLAAGEMAATFVYGIQKQKPSLGGLLLIASRTIGCKRRDCLSC